MNKPYVPFRDFKSKNEMRDPDMISGIKKLDETISAMKPTEFDISSEFQKEQQKNKKRLEISNLIRTYTAKLVDLGQQAESLDLDVSVEVGRGLGDGVKFGSMIHIQHTIKF